MLDSPAPPALPPWVKKRDGRVVPFDPDTIGQESLCGRRIARASRSVFDAGADRRRLALPGGRLSGRDSRHRLDRGFSGQGGARAAQPRLAQAFTERSQKPPTGGQAGPEPLAGNPAGVVQRSLEAFSLATVFSRDLAAAHRDGLLVLAGLEAPRELAAAVLTPPEPSATMPALQSARRGPRSAKRRRRLVSPRRGRLSRVGKWLTAPAPAVAAGFAHGRLDSAPALECGRPAGLGFPGRPRALVREPRWGPAGRSTPGGGRRGPGCPHSRTRALPICRRLAPRGPRLRGDGGRCPRRLAGGDGSSGPGRISRHLRVRPPAPSFIPWPGTGPLALLSPHGRGTGSVSPPGPHRHYRRLGVVSAQAGQFDAPGSQRQACKSAITSEKRCAKPTSTALSCNAASCSTVLG